MRGGLSSPLVKKALAFATQRHAGQRRKGDGAAFITHPVAVARLLREMRMPDEVIAAGILHDVLEDTDTTVEELTRLFGGRVAGLVREVTEPDKRHSWEARKGAYLKHLRRASRGALAVSCADKLHNTRSFIAAYLRDGPAVFDRFSRGVDQKLDYHRKVQEAVRQGWPGCPALGRLERSLQDLEEITRRQILSEPKEVEAKFVATRPSVLNAVARIRSLGPFRRTGGGVERQENRYWDTPDLRLRRARAVLKSRRVGRRMEITFKRELAYERGVSRRIEATVPVKAAGKEGLKRLLAAERPVEPVRRARKITGRRPLQELLTLRTDRKRILFSAGRQKVELDLDRVAVLKENRMVAIHREVELENLSASEEKFRQGLEDLRKRFRGKLRSSRLPKVEIGLRLLNAKRRG